MYKSGYDCWWKIREAYAHLDVPRYDLLSLIDAGVAFEECFAWKMVKTKPLFSMLDSHEVLTRINELHDTLLQQVINFINISQDDELNSPLNVLRHVIKLTYGEETPKITRILLSSTLSAAKLYSPSQTTTSWPVLTVPRMKSSPESQKTNPIMPCSVTAALPATRRL